jgi:type VI secretion system protein ImpI
VPRSVDENPFTADDFIRAFAAAAGVDENALDRGKPEELAKKLGAAFRLTVAEMRQLLGARSEAKRLARSTSQTVIQAFDNNPLKFSPTDDDAMRYLFGPPLRSYLDAQRAISQGFADLKSHQVHTYAAMQQAVRQLAEDLDPSRIESDFPADGGLSAMLGSKKARLWDAYVARWRAKTDRRDDGLVDVFMQYFADCYDRIDRR